MKPKAVFLDLDGTLVEFCIDYVGARSEALGLLERYGLPESLGLTVRDSIFYMDREVKRYMLKRGEPRLYGEIHSRLEAILDRYELRAAEVTRLLPNVRETLRELRGMGLRLILFTADGDKAMNAIVDRTGIRDFFDLLISRGSSMDVKPHPRHVSEAVALSGSKPEESILVGDSVADIISGKIINAITVGVLTGLGSREQLVEAEADYVIESVADLPPIIKRVQVEGPNRFKITQPKSSHTSS
ncbi:MAG: HAD family hydrolase [Candidatus Bathyarchaeia archaeon]